MQVQGLLWNKVCFHLISEAKKNQDLPPQDQLRLHLPIAQKYSLFLLKLQFVCLFHQPQIQKKCDQNLHQATHIFPENPAMTTLESFPILL